MRARKNTTLVALLAVGTLAGCGPTLFDARGVPVVTPTCLDPALPIACLGAVACVAEDDAHCGSGCADCLANPIQHGTTFCDRSDLDLAQHACVRSCDPGFVHDPNGPGCVCAVGQVACGAAGACVTETAAACGASCLSCGAPAGATATCANHTCDYICPAGKEQCTNPATGQPDCCVPPCSAQQVQCGGVCVSESTTQCGPLCANCNDPSNAVPANASAACLGLAGHGACTFACNPGYLKSNGACVQVKAGPGTVALGASHTCVVTAPGGVMCWGANGAGQLGLGDTVNRLTPVDVALAGGASAQFIAAGASHTCAVTSGGGVQCWGSNATAQLGQPLTTASSSAPIAVPAFPPAGSAVTEVAAGAGHTCVVVRDGSLNKSAVCWGANDKGQVGIAPAAAVVTPTTVPNLSGSSVEKIATQVDHTCVVKTSNGQVSCWGSNQSGQTGQSPSPSPSVPGAAVSSLTASAISVGGTHTCAVGLINNANPGVYCWGDRSVRQLGDGLTTPNISTPFRATLIDPAATSDRILTGRAHSCAATAANGAAICAGANNSLQVGVTPPSTSEFAGPQISLGTIDALFGGGDRSCALAAGALKCWGANEHGQLGNNSTTESAVPVSPQPF